MGSSKKHKDKDRESSKKKKKHRSRSRSKERESRKRRHRDRSPDDDVIFQKEENLYSDSREAVPSKIVHDYQHGHKSRDRLPEMTVTETETAAAAPSHGDGSSLSIEETNRLRAKLGLKPLDVGGKGDSEKSKSSGVHAPAINLGDKRKTDALREKVATRKAQRLMKTKLKQVKGLGDSDSDDDTMAWVLKSRKIQKEKDLAEKRAKMLEDMDQDFGIGSLVNQEFKKDSNPSYSSKDLRGLKVEHTVDKFTEGRNIILTLKDKGVLDEEDDDVLVNVNIEDDERAEKNVDNKKKKPDYKPYDEAEDNEYGMMKTTNLLSKYDEEIDGVKKESFVLDSVGKYDSAHEKRMSEIRQQLKAQGQTLSMASIPVAEYFTKEEVDESAKFKKVRKKVRKIRKKDVLKADDILPLEGDDGGIAQDYGSRSRGRGRLDVPDEELEEGEVKADIPQTTNGTRSARPPPPPHHPPPPPPPPGLPKGARLQLPAKMDLDDSDLMGPDEDLTGVFVEEEEAQNELQNALMMARKLKLKTERKSANDIINDLPVPVKEEEMEDEEDVEGSNIILNSTSEFCRNLGEIPTYGLAGNRNEDREEIMDTELELMEQRRQEAEQEEQTGGWNEVDIDENPVDIKGEDTAVLEEEPIASDGIGAALKLAVKKGFLEAEEPMRHNRMSAKAIEELQVQNYTIQDKRYDDLDEKNRKRDRYVGGMTTEFKEKTAYKPEVTLDYVDEGGRHLSRKEAFRQLSHRFHGKGSGKKKTEKRGKKVEEELLMKQMSSTDTPLNTLSLLKDKQKSEKSPYIMLSGNKGFSSNSIMKSS